MTQININGYDFQVEPFVRYKEDRLRGRLLLTSGEALESVEMAIVKIRQRFLNVGELASIPVSEIWGFVLEPNTLSNVLSTLITLRFDLTQENLDPHKIYHLFFKKYEQELIKPVFKLNATTRNPVTIIQKFALEAAQDIAKSKIDFCHDPNLKDVRIV